MPVVDRGLAYLPAEQDRAAVTYRREIDEPPLGVLQQDAPLAEPREALRHGALGLRPLLGVGAATVGPGQRPDGLAVAGGGCVGVSEAEQDVPELGQQGVRGLPGERWTAARHTAHSPTRVIIVLTPGGRSDRTCRAVAPISLRGVCRLRRRGPPAQ